MEELSRKGKLITVQGHPARKYDNRVTVIAADLHDLDLIDWLE